MRDHRRLRVWQRAHALSVRAFRATVCLDGNRGAAHYQAQLRRAVSTMPSAIAEGRGQETAAQFARYLSIAIGSASEAMSHCAEMGELGLIDARDAAEMLQELDEIRAMSIMLRRRLRRRGE